jgi:hypothetical protein
VIVLTESDLFEFVDDVFLAEDELKFNGNGGICTSFDGLERYPSLEFENLNFFCVRRRSKKRSLFCVTAQGCFPWAILSNNA